MIKSKLLVSIFLLLPLLGIAQESALRSAVRVTTDGLEIAQNSPKVDCDPEKQIDRTVSKSELAAHNGKDFEISVVTPEYLNELFQWLSSQKYIPFRFPEDGCYARAQEMARLLESKGIISGKTFIEGDLRVETPNSPKGYVEWWYHVAPVVKVKKDGKEQVYVIDPSIFDHPVPVEEWYHIQTKHQRGRTDEAYYTPRFNYEPFEKDEDRKDYDPREVEDSKQTMEKYLELQNQREGVNE